MKTNTNRGFTLIGLFPPIIVIIIIIIIMHCLTGCTRFAADTHSRTVSPLTGATNEQSTHVRITAWLNGDASAAKIHTTSGPGNGTNGPGPGTYIGGLDVQNSSGTNVAAIAAAVVSAAIQAAIPK
jgi:hypothetical protein